MVEKAVLKLVDRMENENIIEKANREYYEYALITMTEHMAAVASMLMIGMFFHQFVSTIIFIIFFLSLRKRTGGYHADKFWQCYLLTVATYIGVIHVAFVLMEKLFMMYGVLVWSLLAIEIIGTVNHPNMAMDSSELQETKKAARLLALIEFGVIAASTVLEINRLYVCYMSIAMILCSALMCLAKILKQEVKV